MSSYEENRNFEVILRLAFFLFREVLVYTVKKLLEFKIYKIIFVASSVLGIISQEKKKKLSPIFLELWQYVLNSAHTLSSRGRNFHRSVLRVFQKCSVFRGAPCPPRNGIVIDSCRLSPAKRRVSVLTVIEKSNHWRWIQEWFKETERGRWYPPMTATERNPDFSKTISIEADLPKPHHKGWIPH